MKNYNLLLIYISVFLLVSCQQEKVAIKPQLRPLTSSVYSSVTIQPRNAYQAHTTVNGIIEAWFVEEGDVVKKGDRLFQIENVSNKLVEENARLALELAKENFRGDAALLLEIEQDIQAARIRLERDSLVYYRQRTLWEKSIGSRNDFEAKESAYEMSKVALVHLQQKLKRVRNELSSHTQKAEIDYQRAQVNTNDYVVYSLQDGKVYEIFKEVGESVNPQQAVAMIGSSDQFIVEMYVDEVDIVKVKIGQEAIVTLDAYGEQVFNTTVAKIYPKKDDRNQTFLVEAIFRQAPDILYPGLNGEGNIIVEEKSTAIVIPSNYLIDDQYVQTKDDRVAIQTGLRSLEFVEVLAGVDTSTLIYLPEEI